MTSRNPSEPFEEVGHTAGTAARMVEENAGVPPAPVVPVVPELTHTHAADRVLVRTEIGKRRRTEDVGQGLGQWIGDVSRRFETVRQYVRRTDAETMKADAMRFARRYPMQTLAGSLVAGLVVGRLLRRR